MHQQTYLFGPPGAYGAQQETPAKPPGAESRDAAYERIKEGLTPMQRRLFNLYQRAASDGIRTKAGILLRSLTDMEVAKMLGIERTSVNGRRAELIEMGHVEAGAKRPCLVTGNTVTSWRAVPDLWRQP